MASPYSSHDFHSLFVPTWSQCQDAASQRYSFPPDPYLNHTIQGQARLCFRHSTLLPSSYSNAPPGDHYFRGTPSRNIHVVFVFHFSTVLVVWRSRRFFWEWRHVPAADM